MQAMGAQHVYHQTPSGILGDKTIPSMANEWVYQTQTIRDFSHYDDHYNSYNSQTSTSLASQKRFLRMRLADSLSSVWCEAYMVIMLPTRHSWPNPNRKSVSFESDYKKKKWLKKKIPSSRQTASSRISTLTSKVMVNFCIVLLHMSIHVCTKNRFAIRNTEINSALQLTFTWLQYSDFITTRKVATSASSI